MKIVNLTCPGCGARLDVDADAKKATCEFCGAALPIDDEIQKVQLDGAEQAGYDFEKGRQKAQAEAAQQYAQPAPQQPQKKRKTWLWVIGWILIFPVPLTIIMLNKKDLDPKIRYGVIIAGWLVYLAIGFGAGAGGASSSASKSASSASTSATAAQVQSSASASSGSASSQSAGREGYKNIETFINEFNATSGMTITDVKEVDNISDKDSGYYRVEYRLTAFKNAVGAIGQIEGYGQIDIVSYGAFGYSDIRVYADVPDKDHAVTMFKALADVLVSGKDRENIPSAVESLENSPSPSLYLGAKYAASYAYDEIYMEANDVQFD